MEIAFPPAPMRPLVIRKRNDIMRIEEAIKTAFLKRVDIATMCHYFQDERS
jgi:hypothetical protein